MNDAMISTGGQSRSDRAVFVSYATADRKHALSVCKALERRRAKCWISTRDVEPGENYQEEIVRAIRNARAMVLVFSEAANNSDEIKKELSLASRYHVPVMALRIEDVEPSDAFAYELSTRQWIDAFDGWDKSIDALAARLKSAPADDDGSARQADVARRRLSSRTTARPLSMLVAAIAILLIVGSAWLILRPKAAVAHTMEVRLIGFDKLSADLPAGMPDAMRDEIIAAFGDEGVIGVSTASAPAPGRAPAYALGGTIRHDGNQIRVITRLINERSGATLWSSTSNFDPDQVSNVPRRIAADTARKTHCGLFGASTYSKSLPDRVMADYMQYCQNQDTDRGKALDSAQRVVAAAPDFSWGWSAVALEAAWMQFGAGPGPQREEIRRMGLDAVGKALSVDPRNSEALAQQSILIDSTDLIGQEKLFKQAIAARPLDCGCEHFTYSIMLQNAGRYADSIAEIQRAIAMMPHNSDFQFSVADALTAVGKQDEAKPHFDAAVDLSPFPDTASLIAVIEAQESGDYRAGIKALQDPKFEVPANQRAAFLAGLQALASGDRGAKARATQMLLALPEDELDPWTAKMIAVLGAHHEALMIIARRAHTRFDWPSILWYPSMRGVLDDPAIPGVLQRLGLMKYWRTTHTRPDVCAAGNPPAFCHTV